MVHIQNDRTLMEAFAMSVSAHRSFPVLDPASVEPRRGAAYPGHLRGAFAAREKRALGDPLGLTSFGVNLTRLPPGTASALRHWHSLEDEFVMVLEVCAGSGLQPRAREETPESRGMPCLFLNTERGFGAKPPQKSGFRRH